MGAGVSKEEPKDEQVIDHLANEKAAEDEPDEWDRRIHSTGCSDEQTKMNDCYFDTKDWRKCAQEMEAFKACWKRKGNDVRTSTQDA